MYNSQLILNRIESLLAVRGVPKARLNEHCGISRNTLTQSKERPNGLSAKILYDAADFLNCSADYLFGRTDVISVADHETLTPDEADLLAAFRAMSEKDQQRLIGRAQAISEADKSAERKEA